MTKEFPAFFLTSPSGSGVSRKLRFFLYSWRPMVAFLSVSLAQAAGAPSRAFPLPRGRALVSCLLPRALPGRRLLRRLVSFLRGDGLVGGLPAPLLDALLEQRHQVHHVAAGLAGLGRR